MLGKLLGERYQVVQVLGQGIFGQTYMVQDTYLPDHPTCVVKHFLPSSKCPIPVEIRRRLFTREVEALKKLDDYDLVPHLLAHFEDNLEFYLVQEFIEGHPLNVELPLGHRWTESKVFQLLQEVLSILNFVHSHGLIHRDVKPSNIIRRKQDNRLVLIDFGAVKPIQGKTSIFIAIDQHTTIAIGTPGYMPNEQERGKPRPNSDIYALGMIGIQALTGVHPRQLPEDRNTGEVIWQHFAQVNAGLASVLNKMVHYHFKDRYKSATEALEAIEPLTNLYMPLQESIPTPPSVNITLEPHTPDREQDTNEVFEGKVLAPLLGNQTSDMTVLEEIEQLTSLYIPIQDSIPTPPLANVIVESQTPDFRQDTNKVYEDKVSAPLFSKQTSATTISIFTNKFALLIGLVIGVISGLVLMVVSYWSVQITAPAPKDQNSPPPPPAVSR